jgi:hypothetical protein
MRTIPDVVSRPRISRRPAGEDHQQGDAGEVGDVGREPAQPRHPEECDGETAGEEKSVADAPRYPRGGDHHDEIGDGHRKEGEACLDRGVALDGCRSWVRKIQKPIMAPGPRCGRRTLLSARG